MKEKIRALFREIYHPRSFGRGKQKQGGEQNIHNILQKNLDKLFAQPSNSRKFPATGETEQASCVPPHGGGGKSLSRPPASPISEHWGQGDGLLNIQKKGQAQRVQSQSRYVLF